MDQLTACAMHLLTVVSHYHCHLVGAVVRAVSHNLF